MSSPWSQIAKVESVNLMDIMSEQYAHNLQAQEDKKFGQQLADQIISSSTTTLASSPANNDLFAEHSSTDLVDDDVNAGASGSSMSNSAEAVAGRSRRIDGAMAADVLDNVKSSSDYDLDDFCESDRIIAEMLQAQFNKEHDTELKLYEKHQNKNSKVSVSLREYRKVPENMLDEDESEDDEPDEKKHWDRFEKNEKIMGGMSKKGFTYDKDGIRVRVVF